MWSDTWESFWSHFVSLYVDLLSYTWFFCCLNTSSLFFAYAFLPLLGMIFLPGLALLTFDHHPSYPSSIQLFRETFPNHPKIYTSSSLQSFFVTSHSFTSFIILILMTFSDIFLFFWYFFFGIVSSPHWNVAPREAYFSCLLLYPQCSEQTTPIC